MNQQANTSSILVLSQDYELFFHQSGTVENCLLKPSAALREYARDTGVKITFYVDAGMLVQMKANASSVPELARDYDRVRADVEAMVKEGHEVGLHVHPHWSDTAWRNGRWDFTHTRYAPSQFSRRTLIEIFETYAKELADITGAMPTSYRAGGFCLEPFDVVSEALRAVGIFTDSSVVPEACLNDRNKGFDFRHVPDEPYWFFDDDPTEESAAGRFLEVPVTATKVSFFYYWGRLLTRLKGQQPANVFGDGMAKAIGAPSAIKRLMGLDRVVEMSTDIPKVEHLSGDCCQTSSFCHVMGHPKLLSLESLDRLDKYIESQAIGRFETVSSAAHEIRHGSLHPKPS
jgi:hypothetical protein